MSELPTSVRRAIWTVWALVLWGVVATVLTVVLRDDLVLAWAEGNTAAQEVLDAGGLDALKSSSIRIPGFVALSITLFIVYVALAVVLVAFLRGGHAWARMALTVTAVFTSFAIVVGLERVLPLLFAAMSVVALALNVALVWFLWRGDTSRFLRAPADHAAAPR